MNREKEKAIRMNEGKIGINLNATYKWIACNGKLNGDRKYERLHNFDLVIWLLLVILALFYYLVLAMVLPRFAMLCC